MGLSRLMQGHITITNAITAKNGLRDSFLGPGGASGTGGLFNIISTLSVPNLYFFYSSEKLSS